MRPPGNTIKSLQPPTSAITFFQIEDEERLTAGGVIAWEQQVKLRHATNQLYLAVSMDGRVYMSNDSTAPETVFRMYPVIRVCTAVICVVRADMWIFYGLKAMCMTRWMLECTISTNSVP